MAFHDRSGRTVADGPEPVMIPLDPSTPYHPGAMGQRGDGYNWAYQKARRAMLAGFPLCYWCGKPATTADHDPPLATAPTPAAWRGTLRPSCDECRKRQSGQLVGIRARLRRGEARPSRPW